MDKAQFEELLKLLRELNEYMENISSRLSGIDNTLETIKDDLRQKRR